MVVFHFPYAWIALHSVGIPQILNSIFYGWYLVCLHILVVITSAATNTAKHRFLTWLFHVLWIDAKVGIMGQTIFPFKVLKEKSILLSKMVVKVYVPTSSAKEFLFLCILTSTCLVLSYVPLSSVMPHCGFQTHFLLQVMINIYLYIDKPTGYHLCWTLFKSVAHLLFFHWWTKFSKTFWIFNPCQ